MKAKVFSFQFGLQEYENVALIRLRSRQVNLLIMEDHMPLLGDITGEVEFLVDDDEVRFEQVDGYYMHKKNVFELVLKE